MNKTIGNDSTPLVGNDRFEGYIPDMVERLATKADFSYVITLVRDGKFGARLENVGWNGMIREVMDSVSKSHIPVQNALISR